MENNFILTGVKMMDVMGIAKLSTAMSSARISTEISMRVYKMALDQMEDVGDMLAALTADMSALASVDPSVGQLLDVSV